MIGFVLIKEKNNLSIQFTLALLKKIGKLVVLSTAGNLKNLNMRSYTK